MTPLPWSYSSLSGVDNCPKQHKEVKVTKRFKEIPHDKNDWGIRAHKALEDACAGRRKLDPEMGHFQPLVDMVHVWAKDRTDDGALLRLEYKLAITKEMKGCEFFGNGVWGRCVIDVMRILPGGKRAIILDWKTGKRKPSEQLMLCALFVFINHPEVDLIRADFVWLKDGARDTAMWTRDQIPEMWEKMLPLLTQYRNAFVKDQWPARESGLCRGYCPVTDCTFWKEKR